MTTGKKVAAITGLLAVVLLVIEVILRLSLGLGSPPLLQADENIGYLFQPEQTLHRFGNKVTINRYHQRTHEISAEPEDGVFRILMIGDSVTFGGVMLDQGETLSERLRHKLTSTCADSVEVLNASAGSWGVGNAQAYLERFGTFGSSLVILQIGSHDLLQPTATGYVVDAHPSFPSQPPALALTELWSRYVVPRLPSLATLLATDSQSQADEAQPGIHPADAMRDHALFAQNMAYLRTTIRDSRDAGASVVILYTPDRNEVVPEGTGYATTYAPYRARFLTINDSLEVPTIDALSAWRGTKDAASLFRDGVHPSAEGTRALGALTADWIRDRGCHLGR